MSTSLPIWCAPTQPAGRNRMLAYLDGSALFTRQIQSFHGSHATSLISRQSRRLASSSPPVQSLSMGRLLKHKFGIQVRPTMPLLSKKLIPPISWSRAIPRHHGCVRVLLSSYTETLTCVEAATTVALLAHYSFTTSQSMRRT